MTFLLWVDLRSAEGEEVQLDRQVHREVDQLDRGDQLQRHPSQPTSVYHPAQGWAYWEAMLAVVRLLLLYWVVVQVGHLQPTYLDRTAPQSKRRH